MLVSLLSSCSFFSIPFRVKCTFIQTSIYFYHDLPNWYKYPYFPRFFMTEMHSIFAIFLALFRFAMAFFSHLIIRSDYCWRTHNAFIPFAVINDNIINNRWWNVQFNGYYLKANAVFGCRHFADMMNGFAIHRANDINILCIKF